MFFFFFTKAVDDTVVYSIRNKVVFKFKIVCQSKRTLQIVLYCALDHNCKKLLFTPQKLLIRVKKLRVIFFLFQINSYDF